MSYSKVLKSKSAEVLKAMGISSIVVVLLTLFTSFEGFDVQVAWTYQQYRQLGAISSVL